MTLLQEQSNSVSSRAKSRDLNHQSIQTSILQTLKYSDHFGFPLTISEIKLRLVGARSSRPQIIHAINQMLKQSQIEQLGDYFYLPGRKYLISRRFKRSKTSAPQLVSAKTIAYSLSHIPGVLAIYLTGSLAMSNSGPDADIDFMIIAEPNRLWTTRLLLTLYTEFLGLRRRPQSHHASGKICLNLYLTPDSYLLPPFKQSLYTAYELIQAVPLYDPHDTHTSLLTANPWIHQYLPNVILVSDLSPRSDLLRRRPQGVFSRHQNTIRRPGRTLIGFIEFCCYHLQLFYMKSKLTREYITPNSAFFHPHDPGASVLKKVRPAKEMLSLPKHV